MSIKHKMSMMAHRAEQKSQVEKLELESQFLIRFPEDVANEVHKSIEAGDVNEKMSIQLDKELRYGKVRVNNQVLNAKLVDLPTVIESYKTADNLNLYKTADISQLLVCNKETDAGLQRKHKKQQLEKEPEKPTYVPEYSDDDGKENLLQNRDKKKDAIIKVDDKFLWPHGITPPARNLRRRRINNIIKEKCVDPPQPDILRDVKYLLRMDSEAVRVEYEVVTEEELKKRNIKPSKDKKLQLK